MNIWTEVDFDKTATRVDRLLKYKTDRMDILNPMEFIRKKEGNCYDE